MRRADLAHTPSTGIRVQASGHAHLLNFGIFATLRAPVSLRYYRLPNRSGFVQVDVGHEIR